MKGNFQKRAMFIACLLVALAALGFAFKPYLARAAIAVYQRARGTATIEDRVAQYGQQVRARLLPHFKKQGVNYPPRKIVFVGLKQEKRLEIYAAGEKGEMRLIRAYPIVKASGALGPKLREGDLQVPEGMYRIESLNPNSLYHLALRVNYPNAFDRERAKLDKRTNLGGDIMIHGSNGSIGCLAMGDETAENLFVLAAETGIENISVILSPVDFRTTQLPSNKPPLPSWTDTLYEQIKVALKKLPLEQPDKRHQ